MDLSRLSLTPKGKQAVSNAKMEQASLASGTQTGSTQFSDTQMNAFFQRKKEERNAEVGKLNNGFVTSSGAVQPGPTMRGALGLMRSRFDITGGNETDRDHVESALSGATGSMSHNALVTDVGMDLFGNMLKNVGRLNQDNNVRRAFNMSGPPGSATLPLRSDPTRANGAENAKLTVNVNKAVSPHFDYTDNTVSLMNPDQLDQTAHEFQHARDHLHGDLDLNNKDHRLASELNAFSRQDEVSKQLTGSSPELFQNRTPRQMAESYHGKKGYPGTLDSSIQAVKKSKGP